MTDDIRFHERLLRLGDWIDGDPNIDEDLWPIPRQALAEIKRLREWKAVADLFGAAFRMDEWGQYPPSNGDDVHQAARAYEQLRTEEARRG